MELATKREKRVLLKVLREAGLQADPWAVKAAAILLGVNGLQAALEFVEYVRKNRAAEEPGRHL